MRDLLLGYLLNALEPSERESVEEQLGRDPQLRRELEALDACLAPLRADKGHYDPPPGLCERTCAFVAAQATVTVAPSAAEAPPRWTISDFVVAAGIFLASAMLFFPAVNYSRHSAQLAACQNNLRQLGMALTQYSRLRGGIFPEIPTEGNLSTAGIYAAKLVDDGFVTDETVFVCPSSELAEGKERIRIPTQDEMRRAQGVELRRMQQLVGGSFGFNLGYVVDGRYYPTKNLSRAQHALMSDAPVVRVDGIQSANHSRCGQNVLFEDGRVQYLTTCTAEGCRDHIYMNDDRQIAAGTHLNDAVIGASSARPVLTPVSLGE